MFNYLLKKYYIIYPR